MKVAMSVSILLVIGSANAFAVEAHAESDVPQRIVNFSDLDLTRRSGAETLFARIDAAARTVCGPLMDDSVYALMGHVTARKCASDSVARAVADVNAPLLTAYYLAKSPRARVAEVNPDTRPGSQR